LRKTAWLVIFSVATLAFGAPAAGQAWEEKVSQLFHPWDRPDTPGAAVAIVWEGRIAMLKAFGSASLEHRIPITPDTIFDVGSLAKQFTAFAVLQMAEEGALDLSDPVRKHLPEFPEFGTPILIRHLLYHQSGLRDWGGLIQMAGGRMEDPISTPYVMSLLRNQRELNFFPGSEFSYCNAGYIVLTEIIGRTGGIPFPQRVKERIFDPLDMKDARFISRLGEWMSGTATSYKLNRDGKFIQASNDAALPGPGSLSLSIADLAKWMLNVQTRKLGSEALWARFLEVPGLNDGRSQRYAAGLIQGEYRTEPVWSHSGGWAGFRGETLYFPRQRLAIAVLANQTGIDPTGLARRIAESCLEEKLSNPPKTAVAALPLEDWIRSCPGRYWLFGEQAITVSITDEKLKLQIGAGPRLDLEPVGGRIFAFSPAGIRIEFPDADPLENRGLIFWQGDYAYSCEKLADHLEPPADLNEYAGIYYSPELMSAQEIRSASGRLYLPSLKRGDLPLVPLESDAFGGSGSNVKIRFRRDGKKRVVELRLSFGSEARNVRFTRISPLLHFGQLKP